MKKIKLERREIKELLENRYARYNNTGFIETDPVCVPHIFSLKDNIEIAGFLTAIIAWGQRKTIIANAKKLMKMMGNSPYEYIINGSKDDFNELTIFKHRTFNGTDTLYFLSSLQNIYRNYGGLETLFTEFYNNTGSMKEALIHFRDIFFELPHPERTGKHIADVRKNASAKRLNMFLRWMVRKDNRGVDFGLWKHIPASALFMPLDVHTGNVARKLGLLSRKQNDWYAVEELTSELRVFDADDPVKYDFALFGLGAFEAF